MLPKISIITPCLNSEATLERAIQHLIAQNYPNLEYIIIDGNSKDGTIEIIKKYQQHIHIWVSEPDSGTSEAINKGIARATGEFIGFLLADDYYNENTLLKVGNELIKDTTINILYGNINYVGPFRPPFLAKATPNLTKDKFGHPSGLAYLPACFIKRECFHNHGDFDLSYKIVNDYELYLRFISRGVKFTYFDHALVTMHYGGMSSKIDPLMGIELRRAFNTYQPSLYARFIFEIVWCRNDFRNRLKINKYAKPLISVYRYLRQLFIANRQTY